MPLTCYARSWVEPVVYIILQFTVSSRYMYGMPDKLTNHQVLGFLVVYKIQFCKGFEVKNNR